MNRGIEFIEKRRFVTGIKGYTFSNFSMFSAGDDREVIKGKRVMVMFGNFSRDRFTGDMFTNSGGQVSAGLANVAIWALLTLVFLNHVRGEAHCHFVLVGEQVLRF